MRLNTFPEPKKDLYKDTPLINGLRVYYKPMLNGSETQKYFGVNLIEKNILAVYVSAWNDNPTESYIISEDLIHITQITHDSLINHPEKAKEDMADIVYLTGFPVAAATSFAIAAATYPALVASGALIAVPVSDLAVAMYVSKQSSDASIIKKNFENVRCRTHTLEPGEIEGGFVYFNWKALKEYDEVALCQIITKAISNENYPNCVNLPLRDKDDE